MAISGISTQIGSGALRVDKWLWFARFFRSRSLASKMCQSGKVRLNKVVIGKPSVLLRVGDVLTFKQGEDIKIVKVLEPGVRRGPANEALLLYEDLSPENNQGKKHDIRLRVQAMRKAGSGRPTKKERRDMERLRVDRFGQDKL